MHSWKDIPSSFIRWISVCLQPDELRRLPSFESRALLRIRYGSLDSQLFGLTPIGESVPNRAMRTNRTMLLALALLLTATAATFAANALMGTWKLNESKSKFAPGAAKNTTVTYTPAKADVTECTVDAV